MEITDEKKKKDSNCRTKHDKKETGITIKTHNTQTHTIITARTHERKETIITENAKAKKKQYSERTHGKYHKHGKRTRK